MDANRLPTQGRGPGDKLCMSSYRSVQTVGEDLELSQVSSFSPRVDQNMALRASTAVKNAAFLHVRS